MDVSAWPWGLILTIGGVWLVVSFAFALALGRLIRAGGEPAPRSEEPMRESGVVPKVGVDTEGWDEMAAQLGYGQRVPDPDVDGADVHSLDEVRAARRASGE